MYLKHFGFSETPFSLAPDPRYLYMSERHREALAHLLFGIQGDGGFVLLTGEVGTGKTTLCRALIGRIPSDCQLAFVLNPKVSALELLATICDELGIPYNRESRSSKEFIDRINVALLRANAAGRKTILVIDEAQNLADDVLEQVRLLTNLETSQRKLLQIVLLAQPELRVRLAKPNLRQLNQRILARYHLERLTRAETAGYVGHRLAVAGVQRTLFSPRVLDRLHRLSGGTPRLINVISDRALLGAYVEGRGDVDLGTLNKAAREVFGDEPGRFGRRFLLPWIFVSLAFVVLGGGVAAAYFWGGTKPQPVSPPPVSLQQSPADVPRSLPPPALGKALAVPSPDLGQEVLRRAGNQEADHEAAALAAVFRQWHAEPVGNRLKTACRPALGDGLRCLAAQGTLGDVEALNLPAVVRLRQEGGADFFAALLGLGSDAAELAVDGERTRVRYEALQRQWAGEYAVIWRGPPGTRSEIGLHSRGDDVAWLARALAQAEGSAPLLQPESNVFDAALRQQVMRFQSAQGLEADGIAGPRTLARLAAGVPGDRPRLLASTSQ